MNPPTPPLILASSSPQRRRLLSEAGYKFEVMDPQIREPDPTGHQDGAGYVTHTAWLKARAAAAQVRQGIILAADTVVTRGGAIMGKAADREHARQILAMLSGSEHTVLTGLCLWHRPGDFWMGSFEETLLHMRPLSAAELEAYVATDRWVGKAGAYAIQDPDPYVSIIRGSHSNVVGLPMELVATLLERSGIS